MDSKPTIELPHRGFSTLDANREPFTWIDLGSLSDYDSEDILRGLVNPGPMDVWAQGRRAGDLLCTNWSSLFVASPHMVDVLTAKGLTGWACSSPLSVKGMREMPVAHLLSFSGRCGHVDIPDIMVGEKTLHLPTWDGSDFFVAPNIEFVFVSPHATETLRKAELKNVVLDHERLTVAD